MTRAKYLVLALGPAVIALAISVGLIIFYGTAQEHASKVRGAWISGLTLFATTALRTVVEPRVGAATVLILVGTVTMLVFGGGLFFPRMPGDLFVVLLPATYTFLSGALGTLKRPPG